MMKRNYVTPAIAVEYYNLTQSIAVCETKIGLLNSECVMKDRDSTPQMTVMAEVGYFMQEGQCAQWMQAGVNQDGICYHTNANAAFNS